MKEQITIIDPPGGWRYGFPKPIPQDRLKDVNTWLVEQGYPKEEIDSYGDFFYCRFWKEDIKVNWDTEKLRVLGWLAKNSVAQLVENIFINLKFNEMATPLQNQSPIDRLRQAIVFNLVKELLEVEDYVSIDLLKNKLRESFGGYYWNTEFIKNCMTYFCKAGVYKYANNDHYCLPGFSGKATPAPVSKPATTPATTKKTKDDKWTIKSTVSKSKALWMMENNKGRFFSVQFVKKGDKSLRTMNCQYLPGQKVTMGIVKVKEACLVRSKDPNPIRSFDLNTVKKVSIAGCVYGIK